MKFSTDFDSYTLWIFFILNNENDRNLLLQGQITEYTVTDLLSPKIMT